LKYRPDIDGLRALAVVPVILFHAGFELFSGGFVGVDVFFVISGYLITTILIEDIENERFSIVNFYERRARRILPALFFVMLVCIPFAWMWMLPSQMKGFSQSLVAVSLFASNILFWQQSGYFDASVEEKPLLHTWSLAVEEQYYVLFPIFLILFWRFGKNRVFWMIVMMAAISLLLSEWGWRNKPSANFYLAPTRAWELFAGSIAAFIVQKRGVQKNNTLALLGLTAIIFSIFAYNETTPFPSAYALVPVVGVVLLILYANKETLVARLLSTKIFVGIGLISYSAYLWHQPIFAFAEVLWIDVDSALATLLVLVTVPFAYTSWRYVEKPFRNRRLFERRKIYTLSAFGIVIFSAFGFTAYTTNGFETRYDWTEHYYITSVEKEKFNDNCTELYPDLANFHTCRMSNDTPPTIALIGDSHSHSLYEALSAKYDNETIINIGQFSCLPFVTIEHKEFGNCELYQSKANAFLKANPQIHTIILSGYWGYLASGGFSKKRNGYRIHDDISASDEVTFINNASEFINLHQAKVENMILVEDVPDLDFAPVRCYNIGVYRFLRSECFMSYKNFKPRRERVRKVLEKLMQSHLSLNYVEVVNIFCDEERCTSLHPAGTLYINSDHISRLGAELVSEKIISLSSRIEQ
jgi:peptidoglycan/LPS O-acetylase OafA/YrhL